VVLLPSLGSFEAPGPHQPRMLGFVRLVTEAKSCCFGSVEQKLSRADNFAKHGY